MENITWEVVDASKKRRKLGAPMASVGYGRIALNGDACDLVNAYDCEWAEILLGRVANKLEKIAIKFVGNRTKTAIKVTRKKKKDSYLSGIDINSKSLIRDLFGENGVTSIRRYSVSKQDENTIIIDLKKEV